MLILSRRVGERVCIGRDIWVEVKAVHGNRVCLGISAPRDVEVDREEIRECKLGRPITRGPPP